MMPSLSHTGTPEGFDGFCHFTVSATSGHASRMSLRMRASASPRQSPRDAILASIRRDGSLPVVALFEELFDFFAGAAFVFFMLSLHEHPQRLGTQHLPRDRENLVRRTDGDEMASIL